MAQVPQTLDQLGIPQEMRDRMKIIWIITAVTGLWGWVLGAYLWKVEGQEQNPWYQFQLKQNLYVGIIWWVLSWTGIGALVGFIFGLMGFLAIGKGNDFEAPIIGGMARK